MNCETYKTLILIWMGIAAAIFLLLLRVTAPYGRHASAKWGPQVSNRMGWVVMEAPGMMLMAIIFNLANGFFLGYYFAHFAEYSPGDFLGAGFITGTILFAAGMFLNWDYDNRLIHLRKPGETGYKIPRGGLFKYISCPNLMGEVIEWTGYAIMSWNLPALSFLVWTIANLVPRAISHHRWYKKNFDNYPEKRKAIIPFVI